jgi:cytochrome oxidase assembly protein ShyY1
VMDAAQPLPEQQQWRKVIVTGTYDVAEQTLVRYQTRDGRPGVNVITPLHTEAGSTVLVDRGWMQVTNDPTAPVDLPDPPAGRVTVTGWAVQDQSGEPDQVTPNQGEVRLVSSRGFTGRTEGPVLQGYVRAAQERPAPQQPLVRAEPPELNSGPHFFYGLQWWFFGALALGGFAYFAWAEARDRRRGG